MKLNKSFQLRFLNLRAPLPRELAPQYRQAYATWNLVWSQVHERFQLPLPLQMDNFLRHDDGAFIFTEQSCVGMILFRTLDFGVLDFRNDSYFKYWTDADIAALLTSGRRVFTAGWLCVHPDYRAFDPDIKFKLVLLDLMVKRFLESEAEVMANTSRRDRAIGDEGLKRGGSLIRENVPFFGGKEIVDLLSYTKAGAQPSADQPLAGFVNSLWNNRTDWKRVTARVSELAA